MNRNSLPQYPNSRAIENCDTEKVFEAQPRSRRNFLLELVWFIGFIVILICLKQLSNSFQQKTEAIQERTPLSFDVVMNRFKHIKVGMDRESVVQLLGPENYMSFHESDFDAIEKLIEAHPDRYRGENTWAKWADSTDKNRWVAVFFSNGVVRRIIKKGF